MADISSLMEQLAALESNIRSMEARGLETGPSADSRGREAEALERGSVPAHMQRASELETGGSSALEEMRRRRDALRKRIEMMKSREGDMGY